MAKYPLITPVIPSFLEHCQMRDSFFRHEDMLKPETDLLYVT